MTTFPIISYFEDKSNTAPTFPGLDASDIPFIDTPFASIRGSSLSICQSNSNTSVKLCSHWNICHMIKGNESDVANVVFEIRAKKRSNLYLLFILLLTGANQL